MKSSPDTIAFNVCREWFFVLSSLSEKKFVLNAEEKLMQPKTSQKFKNVACFRLLFKIKQPKRLQSTKSVAINTWFLLIKPNFNVKMQRYETNHRKRVVEENLNQFWSNKFLPKTYSPSFGGCRKTRLPPNPLLFPYHIIQIIFHCHNFFHRHALTDRHPHFVFNPKERVDTKNQKGNSGYAPDG